MFVRALNYRPLRYAVWFTILAILWLLLSDQLVMYLFSEAALVSSLKSLKAALFVFIIGGMGYGLMNRSYQKLKLKNRKLEQSINTQQILTQEVHHRVKNNLAIISGLLDVQAVDIKDSEAEYKLLESRNRIFAIARVHELLYQSESMAMIDMSRYIPEMVAHVKSAFTGPAIEVKTLYEVNPVILNVNKAIPLGLIINELVTNAFQHAFGHRGGGVLKLKLKRTGRLVELEIRDDGPGFDWNGGASAPGKSLGLEIVENLVDQLDGQWQYANKKGSVFLVRFSGNMQTS